MTDSNDAPPALPDLPANAVERDTLAYCFGALIERVLRRAFSDREVIGSYASWLERLSRESVKDTATVCLIHAGGNAGHLKIRGRARAWEFLVQLEHAEFQCLLAVSYEAGNGHLDGLWVLGFDGTPASAATWAIEMRELLIKQPPVFQSTAPPPNPKPLEEPNAKTLN